MVMGFGISGMGFWGTVGGGRVTWWMGWGFPGLLSGLCGLLGWVVVLVGLCGAFVGAMRVIGVGGRVGGFVRGP
jgi:hypothetical protein